MTTARPDSRDSLARRSDGVVVDFAGADAHHLLDRRHEDLAVTNLPGLGGLDDRLNATFDVAVLHDYLELDLGQEVDDVFGAAIQLGVTLLAAETLDLGDGQTGHADLPEGLAHFLELERFDDRSDLFHGRLLVVRSGPSLRAELLPARALR